MRTFVYQKLIRDKILDHMLSQGEQPKHHILNDHDYLLELKKKILEEGSEIALDDHDKLLSELADLQEVLDCMIAAIGENSQAVKAVQDKKNSKLGSFGKRVFIDTVAIPEANEWIKYLESNPDRYPEIEGDSD